MDAAENDYQGGNSAAPARKVQVIEVLVFLFLIFPSLALSFLVSEKEYPSFLILSISTILHDLALVSLILYFIWRNGEHPGRIGLRLHGAKKEIVLGIGLFFPFFFGAGYLETILSRTGIPTSPTPLPSYLSPSGLTEFCLAFIMVVVVALVEETIFRGYLILRFQTLTRSSGAAVLLSALIFALGHGYEGTARVITVWVMGLALAMVYLWRRSLVAPMVMHFLQDFIATIIVPLTGSPGN